MEAWAPMRRKDRQLSEERARALLQAGEWGTLASVDAGGQPSGTPLSYVLMGDAVYFHCAMEGLKVRNMQAEPRVCFTVVDSVQPIYYRDFTTFYESAMVYGRASAVADEAEKAKALRAICLKYLPEDADKIDAAIEKSIGRTAVYRISIDHITGKAKQAAPTGDADGEA